MEFNSLDLKQSIVCFLKKKKNQSINHLEEEVSIK